MKTENEIYNQLVEHEILYRNGEPEISDSEFDDLVLLLKKLNPKHKYFTQQFTVDACDTKHKLPIKMRSLDKVKSIEEFNKWCNKVGLNQDDCVVITPKYDGLSILYKPCTGEAFTRGGDDNMGFRRDKHLDVCQKYVPSELHGEGISVGGEILISRENWNKFFSGKTNSRSGEEYKTPRGTVAGLVNSPTASYLLGACDFIPYLVFDDNESLDCDYSSVCSLLYKDNNLCNTDLGVPYVVSKVKFINENTLISLHSGWNKAYECDGLVISVNDSVKRKSLGRDPKTNNPRHSVAFKGVFDKRYDTEVLDINVKVAKSGYLKPTVKIKPVIIDGCEIDNPTGNNMSWLYDRNIAKGSMITIVRSGSVIPKIVETKSYSNNEITDLMDRMATCPVCEHQTCWNETHTDIMCTNEDCDGIKLAKICYFFECMEFEEFGESTIYALYNNGFKSIREIIEADYSDLIKVPGIGDVAAKKIKAQTVAMFMCNEIPLSKLMKASDVFPGVGDKKAEIICDYIRRDGKSLRDLKFDDVYMLNGIGESIANSIINGVIEFEEWVQYNGLKYSNDVDECVIAGDKFAGESVCFSGVRDKALEEQIKANGGKVVSGVSGNTTMLVVKDPSESTSKIEKARSLGVKILSIEEAKQL